MSLGRYGTCGRVDFKDNDVMWDFIKSNKRKKFEFDGIKDALWWSVEKTDAERLKIAKVSYLVNNLKDFLVDKLKISVFEAKKRVDGDYSRGYIMFITEASEVKEDPAEDINIERKHQRILDSKYGDQYFVKEGTREIQDLLGFDWDAAISHVNAMISKAEEYANS